jgi:hypothetical protein
MSNFSYEHALLASYGSFHPLDTEKLEIRRVVR